MTVTYVPFDGEQVSREWGVVLHDMRDDGVTFRVNEGHRTWARQTYFRWLYEHVPGSALAARPSANAPHIRTGRLDHAIDFWNAGGAMHWLRTHGLSAQLTVPGESWHIEIPAAELVAYAREHGQTDAVIKPFYVKPFRKPDGAAVKRLQTLLRGNGQEVKVTGRYDRATRGAVRRFQHKHGLKVDGIVGPGTWKAIRKAVK